MWSDLGGCRLSLIHLKFGQFFGHRNKGHIKLPKQNVRPKSTPPTRSSQGLWIPRFGQAAVEDGLHQRGDNGLRDI